MKFIKEHSGSVHYTQLRESTSSRRITRKNIILVALVTIVILTISGICLWRLRRQRAFPIDNQKIKINCSTCFNLTTISYERSVKTAVSTSQSSLSSISNTLQATVPNSIVQTVSVHSGSSTTRKTNDVGICANATWMTGAVTVAGGRGMGANLNQLNKPRGAFVDDTGAIYITDDNLRVVKWERRASSGVMVAGFGGRGSNNDQFEYYLHNLAVNKVGTMFICDKGNLRVMRWMKDAKSGVVILSTVNCYGVALDDEGSLYVSNLNEDLILRYRENSSGGETIAGGNGRGASLNQFNRPHFPFVDHNFNIFVPDTDNHRVMKWSIGSKEGIVVSNDNSLHQLRAPHAVVVDHLGNIYIVDHDLHQVIRWLKDAQSGELLFGGHGYGGRANQFAHPIDIDFDQQGNLYITDRDNHRIQMFTVNKSSCDLSFSNNMHSTYSNVNVFP